eukprot:Plantae.Rhodophyta-Purpureofilum_apyrenoidigerum.ctg10920.p1 GENE.Plantae.Rhodophyta-Purpureofilum_apyrenoidigerum.ctg10920~~Plantae.Rhodophyta-Purpureofilum_apyrenoidigerum.ctg10920.p1  ORF type:complete len:730 (+),score=99.91 Plantae.Rhodophyta-Purpureofilum_apyrenoidigerum.ctg10920:198-2387(+)
MRSSLLSVAAFAAMLALVAAQDSGEPEISRECFQALKECEDGSRGRACVLSEGTFRTFDSKQTCCESEVPAYASCVNKYPECFGDERSPIADILRTCEVLRFSFDTDYDFSGGTVLCDKVREFCGEGQTSNGERCVFQGENFDTNSKRETCCSEQIPPYTQCLQERSDSCPIDGDFGSQLAVILRTCQVIGLGVSTDFDYSSAAPSCGLVQSHCEGAAKGYNCIAGRENVSAATVMSECCREDAPAYAECVTSKQDVCPLADEKRNEIAVFAATCDLMNLPFTTSVEATDPDCGYVKRFCDSNSLGFECTTQDQPMDVASRRESCCRTELPKYGNCIARYTSVCDFPDDERAALANRFETCDVIGLNSETDFDATGGETICPIVLDFCGDSSMGRECVAVEGEFEDQKQANVCCRREIPMYRRCLEGKEPPCSVGDLIGNIQTKQDFCSSRGLEPEPTPPVSNEPDIDTDGDGVPDANGIDTDGDGVPDSVDTDGDGIPDSNTLDTDGDGKPDSVDTNNDGQPDVVQPDGSEDEGSDSGDNNTSANPACFPSTAQVELRDGSFKLMRDLNIGDHVKSSATDFSEIFAFSHRMDDIVTNFVRIETADGHAIELSSGHYIYVNGVLIAASTARIGDKVITHSGSPVSIAAISTVRRQGLYNPQTISGTIVVDGVQASAYTLAVPIQIARVLLFFPKMLYKLGVRDPLFSLLDGHAPQLVWTFMPSSPKVVA